MHAARRQALLALPIILLVATGVAFAGSTTSVEFAGLPLFAWAGILAFVVNWLAFIPAYLFQTERYYDLTGGITHLSASCLCLLAGPGAPRAWLLFALIAIWAMRLASFLFRRILEDGSDGRFDRIKPDAIRFLMTWSLQGLWVYLTLACALASMSATTSTPLGFWACLGAAVWLVGFVIEVVADQQKRAFRADPANDGRFITKGLWSRSRHPNYFGEILLWCGVALVALPDLSGWSYVTLISPIFVFVLLTRISGVPLLESRAQRRWGEDPSYRAYRDHTPVLVPRLGAAGSGD